MKRNELIESLINESSDIEIPELSPKVRQTPITVIPIEIRPIKKKSKFYAPILRTLIIFALSLGILYSIITKAETKVTIDINPSIEFTVNRFDKVIGVKAYNKSGEIFLQEMNLNLCTTEEAVSRIISHAEQCGYIKQDANNALLYSVSTIAECSYKYESKLKRAFSSAFSKINRKGDLHSVEPSPVDEEEAIRHGVSPAKYAFIRELYAKRMKRDFSPHEIPEDILDDSVTDIVNQLAE